MKKNIHKKLFRYLKNGIALVAVSSLTVSCMVVYSGGGYSETDGVYYDPTTDTLPEGYGDYQSGNKVGEYYDYQDTGVIEKNRQNKAEQNDRFGRNWQLENGNSTNSDWGTYAGSETNYYDWGYPYYGWGFGYNPWRWGFGYNSWYGGGYYGFWGSPWGFYGGYDPFYWDFYWGWNIGFGYYSPFYWGGYPYYGYNRAPYRSSGANRALMNENRVRNQMSSRMNNSFRGPGINNSTVNGNSRSGYQQNRTNSYYNRTRTYNSNSNSSIRSNTYRNQTFQNNSSRSGGFRNSNSGGSFRSSGGFSGGSSRGNSGGGMRSGGRR